MTDLSAPFADGAVTRAARFPTTVRALTALGVSRAVFMPMGFDLAAQDGRVILRERRQGKVILSVPALSVRGVSVEESRSRPPYPQVALAICLKVETENGDVDLPIVPVSADGRRSLTWNDAEVRQIAQRLRDAIQRESNDHNDA